MTRNEAWEVLQGHEFTFTSEDCLFGDGSHSIGFDYVLDSKNMADQLKDAIAFVLNDVKSDSSYVKREQKHEVKVISDSRKEAFENALTMMLDDGWSLLSTSCGFLNSERYGFEDIYQAILMKGGSND